MMLAIGGEALNRDPPISIGEIYKTYVDYWLVRDPNLAPISPPARRLKFVEDLALTLVRSGRPRGAYIEEIEDYDGIREWTSLRGYLSTRKSGYFDTTRSFLLLHEDGTLAFAHRSFVEYFCAQLMVRWLRELPAVDKNTTRQLYSNLMLWFMRPNVSEHDYTPLSRWMESDDVYLRRLAYGLLPVVAGEYRDLLAEAFETKFEKEPDIDSRRHILYGLGYLGKNPCDPRFLTYVREHEREWQRAAEAYYPTEEQQRHHCVARLHSFRNGDRTFFGARGLYILDLGHVGTLADVDLIAEYTDPEKERDREVCEIALQSLDRINKRLAHKASGFRPL